MCQRRIPVLRVAIDEPWQKESVETIARRFEDMHPDVSVHVDLVSNGAIRSDLYAGESTADLVQLFNDDITDSSRDRLLLDLQPWIDSAGIAALFHPSILQLVRTDSGITTIPISATMKGIFYNKMWFDKANIPYPEEGWTWEDFLEIAYRLQRSNVSPGEERYAARISFHQEYIGLLLLTAGTYWLSPDRTKATGYANSPEAVKAITWAAELVRKHRVARATQEHFSNSDLIANETGMVLDYWIMLHEIQPHLKGDLGIAGLPHFQGGVRINEPWISGFGISARTQHLELVRSLLYEISCTSNELTRLVTQGFISPLHSVYEEAQHDCDPLRCAILAEMAYGGSLPVSPANLPYFRLLEDFVNPALSKIVFEGEDVKETLDDLAEKLDIELVKRMQ
ncbi:ABC transporter substrate-binding protein [Paenibacillus sp. KQZ6P-2]|uniref:ABC transporter substrate-binding protein n=1 Tax=Paenibacillus mangrovi TaxID=2931978 RepID=A0A9X1WR01_9BACL|nr:ABC transporter substrate-binding protein [Paenibacillus mangrovi]MCJ8013479.1 ABC transporter substrate-binding protein [Paenibacillus mangrovi]